MKDPDLPNYLAAVAAAMTIGFCLGAIVCGAAHASDNGQRQPISDDSPLPPTEGCNPYIEIHPPDLPPDASNMNGVRIELHLGDICGHWRARPQTVPPVPLKGV